jgi:hypothetical protein
MVDSQPLDCRPIHIIGGNDEKTSITSKTSQNFLSIQHGYVRTKEHSGNQLRTFYTLI